MLKAFFQCDRRSLRVGVASESMIVNHRRGSVYELKNTPLTRFNLVYGDFILCRADESSSFGLNFVRLYSAGGFSTFRKYPLYDEWGENKFLSSLSRMNDEGCGVSAHRNMGLAAVSVPPELDLHRLLRKTHRDLRGYFRVELTADRHPV